MVGRNNIFAIDFDAVVQTIKEANENLKSRHEELMAARDRMPATLQSDVDASKAKKFAEQLKTHTSNCRSTRLLDTKPLRELVNRVESFFKEMEREAKSAQKEVINALGHLARSEQSFATDDGVSIAPNKPFLVNDETGEILGNTSPAIERRSVTAEEIKMSWEIDAVNATLIDLETLRPYLTETALLNAARKHLKKNGPHSLQGASYRQVAVL
ncbi:hypothetical protein [Roseibium sp.]|uniref:hypothetical protein n=1 Tax=Roseibium sp. TaxID=1936156 RepID=UPI003BA9BF34